MDCQIDWMAGKKGFFYYTQVRRCTGIREYEGMAMGAKQSVVLLEFNELAPELMTQFINAGHLPNFKALFEQSQTFITDAEEDAPYLEPWIQWVTVHTGLPYHEHKVFHLDEAHTLQEKWVWDLISDAGSSVFVCGSMNIGYKNNPKGMVIPDPWSTKALPYPEKPLNDYLNFIQKNVQEYTNERMKNTIPDVLKFIKFMMLNGLSMKTMVSTVKQLISEKTNKNVSWRRAFLLDSFQLDVFKYMYKKQNPQFATFFSNSTAHMQHLYWRYMEPDKFKKVDVNSDKNNLKDAILHGYQANDAMVGEVLKFVDKDAIIIFCTALSQKPCLIYEEISGKQGYRPYSIETVLQFAGINYFKSFSPVMSEQFRVVFNSEQEARDAQLILESLQLNNTPCMSMKNSGLELVGGCSYFAKVDKEAVITNAHQKSMPFYQLFYPLSDVKSGMHQRDGMLWIRTLNKKHHVHSEKVAISRITPTILEFFNIPKPENIKAKPLDL